MNKCDCDIRCCDRIPSKSEQRGGGPHCPSAHLVPGAQPAGRLRFNSSLSCWARELIAARCSGVVHTRVATSEPVIISIWHSRPWTAGGCAGFTAVGRDGARATQAPSAAMASQATNRIGEYIGAQCRVRARSSLAASGAERLGFSGRARLPACAVQSNVHTTVRVCTRSSRARPRRCGTRQINWLPCRIKWPRT